MEATIQQAQKCVSCVKVRVLSEHNIWSHWQETGHVSDIVRQNADLVVCEHCQKRRNANVRNN